MPLKIFNTLSGQKEIFGPLTPGAVRMYVCGVTVYDSSHIGHARALLTFDGNAYRGRFEIHRKRTKLSVINVVPLDAYLQGVVPSEMPCANPRPKVA